MSEIFTQPWYVAALVLFIGCWLQTLLGFGMAVLAAPVIVLVKPDWAPFVLVFMAFILSAINAWNLRTHVEVQNMLPAFITRLPSTALGTWLLLFLSTFWLQVLIASAVLFAVATSLVVVKFKASPRKLAVASFVSGFMGTTTSIGGPPMALVMQHGDPDQVRANLSLYFVYSCALSLLSYVLVGLMSLQLLLVGLSFVPFALLGFWLGKAMRPWVDERRFRPLMLSLCTLSALVALVGTLV